MILHIGAYLASFRVTLVPARFSFAWGAALICVARIAQGKSVSAGTANKLVVAQYLHGTRKWTRGARLQELARQLAEIECWASMNFEHPARPSLMCLGSYYTRAIFREMAEQSAAERTCSVLPLP